MRADALDERDRALRAARRASTRPGEPAAGAEVGDGARRVADRLELERREGVGDVHVDAAAGSRTDVVDAGSARHERRAARSIAARSPTVQRRKRAPELGAGEASCLARL